MNEFTKITLKVKKMIKDKENGYYVYDGFLFIKWGKRGHVNMVTKVGNGEIKAYNLDENAYYRLIYDKGTLKERIKL